MVDVPILSQFKNKRILPAKKYSPEAKKRAASMGFTLSDGQGDVPSAMAAWDRDPVNCYKAGHRRCFWGSECRAKENGKCARCRAYEDWQGKPG